MDYGALSPEVNSGRMYAGPGAGSLRGAAVAWDRLAGELRSAAASYQTVISRLSGEWQGPSSASMAAAAAPYAAWMSASAAGAEQAANQARVAASAYEAAFAATVPPPVIAANRAQRAALMATNILGQNTAAIAATEVEYAQMWAQDAAVMYGYAAQSAAATAMTSFTEPPGTGDPGGVARQGGAVAGDAGAAAGNAQTTLSQLVSGVPQSLQSLAAPAQASAPLPPIIQLLDQITGPTGLLAYSAIPSPSYLLAFQSVLMPINADNLAGALAKVQALPAAGSAPPPPALAGGLGSGTQMLGSTGVGGAGSAVSAGAGRAGLVGGLSVPPGWAAANPAVRMVAAALPGGAAGGVPVVVADGQGNLVGGMATAGLAGRALAGTGPRSTAGTASRVAAAPPSDDKPVATIIVIPESADD